MTITGNFERFQYFNFETNFLKNVNPIQKTGVPFLKLLCQKPMLRQIEWGLQNGPVTMNGVLSVTTFFCRKFYFSLRTPCKELI